MLCCLLSCYVYGIVKLLNREIKHAQMNLVLQVWFNDMMVFNDMTTTKPPKTVIITQIPTALMEISTRQVPCGGGAAWKYSVFGEMPHIWVSMVSWRDAA